MKDKLRILILSIILCVIALFLQCSVNVAGGGTEDINTKTVMGVIYTEGNQPAPNTQVMLITSNYNPVTDAAIPDSLKDTTESDGSYSFQILDSGQYNIEAVHLSQRTRLLLTGIITQNDTTLVARGILKEAGVVKVYLPDTIDTANGYLFIEGTTITSSLSNAVTVPDSGYSLMLDSIPEATIPSIHYDKPDDPVEPELISDTLTVTSNDTTVTEAFVYWAQYTTANSGLPDMRIQDIFCDTDGTIWIGTFYGGVAHFDGVSWAVYNTGNSMLPRDLVSEVFRDTDGSLWIVTQGGIAIVAGSSWSTLTTANSAIPTNSLTGFVKDRSGNKWFSSFDGIIKYDGSLWTLYDSLHAGLPSNEMVHVAVDSNNHIWCCGLYGVSEFDGTSWKNYTTANSGIAFNYAYKMFVDSRKNIWFGHEGAVSKFDGTNWVIYNQTNSSILQYRAFEFYEHANGDIWIGTSYGLTRYAGGQFIDVTGERYSLLRNKCYYEITADTKNNMWFGTASDGVIGFGPTKK